MFKCEGKTKNDCMKCNSYFSIHSLHYSSVDKKKIVTLSCSVGGDRKFNEYGEWINNN